MTKEEFYKSELYSKAVMQQVDSEPSTRIVLISAFVIVIIIYCLTL